MAEVTVIRPGVVRVGPDQVDEDDVLELAEALIQEHGHIQNTGQGPQGEMSIHHAIGEAAGRITQETSGKSGEYARPIKDRAAAKFRRMHADPNVPAENTETGEVAINDRPGVDQAAAIGMLRAARGAADAV